MLVGEPVVEGESHKLEIWRSRAHTEHVLREIVIGERLLLFLHVVTKPAQIPATESRNPILHEPLLAEVCDSRIGAEPFPQRNGEVDIVDLGHVGRLDSLGGDGPGDGRRRFFCGLFLDRRLCFWLDGWFIDLELVHSRQNVD